MNPIYTPVSSVFQDLYSPNIFRVIESSRMRWTGHVACMGGKERCIQGFEGGRLERRRPLGRPSSRWEYTINLQEMGKGAWTGLICLSIRTSCGLLWTRWWTFGFHKMRSISGRSEKLLAFSRRTLLLGVSLVNILPSMRRSSKCSFSFRPLYSLLFTSVRATFPAYLIFLVVVV